MKWLLLLPLLLAACAPSAPVHPSLQEQVGWLQAQVLDLTDKQAEDKARSCKALYISWATAVKVGWVQDRSIDDALPGCPTWGELNK